MSCKVPLHWLPPLPVGDRCKPPFMLQGEGDVPACEPQERREGALDRRQGLRGHNGASSKACRCIPGGGSKATTLNSFAPCPSPLGQANAERLDSEIVYDRDFDYDYFGFKTLERSYLLRVNGKVVERPQHMLMRVAVGIHGEDIESGASLCLLAVCPT